MLIKPECYPCLLEQILQVASIVGISEDQKKDIIKKICGFLYSADDSLPPPYISRHIYRMFSEYVGIEDPYKNKKSYYNKLSIELYPKLKSFVKSASDTLLAAVKISIVGNIIDFGVANRFSLEDIDEIDSLPIKINHYEAFKEALVKSDDILYIADNAGEIGFDKVLVEELVARGKRVFFAVRGRPIINDATYDDALEVGIDKIAKVIDSGSDAPGVAFDKATDEFLHLFKNADIVISKGQGNFETLEDAQRPIFFFLRAKCAVVANILGVDIGDIVIMLGGKDIEA